MARKGKKTHGKTAAGPTGERVEVSPSGTSAGQPTSTGLARFEDLDRLFGEFLSRRWPSPFGSQWPSWREFTEGLESRMPSIDIMDEDKEIVVRAEVPGVDRKDLDVSIVDRTLTIKGTTRKEAKEERKDFYRHEIQTGEFSRSVMLPAEVNADKATATHKNGVVELHLPKRGGASRKRIAVS